MQITAAQTYATGFCTYSLISYCSKYALIVAFYKQASAYFSFRTPRARREIASLPSWPAGSRAAAGYAWPAEVVAITMGDKAPNAREELCSYLLHSSAAVN